MIKVAKKIDFKFEGVDPETGKAFKVVLSGWVPEDLIYEVQKHISRILVGATSQEPIEDEPEFNILDIESLPIIKRVEILILKYFYRGWFTSKDIQEQYKEIFDEEIKSSTVSMCLQRLYKQDGILERRGSRAQRNYRLIADRVKKRLDEVAKLKLP